MPQFSLKRFFVVVTLLALSGVMIWENVCAVPVVPYFAEWLFFGSSGAIGASLLIIWGYSNGTLLTWVLGTWALLSLLVISVVLHSGGNNAGSRRRLHRHSVSIRRLALQTITNVLVCQHCFRSRDRPLNCGVDRKQLACRTI